MAKKEKRETETFPFEVIHWSDHSSFHENSWRTLKESCDGLKEDGFEVWSAGWVLEETKHRIILLGSFAPKADQATHQMNILKGTIIRRYRIPRHNIVRYVND